MTDYIKRKLDRLMEKPDKPAYIPEPPKIKATREPPEFIRNIWGSSAGVGSGDFHIYRGIRRRENARQQQRQKETEMEQLDREYEEKKVAQASALEQKLEKKRAKRLKKKKQKTANPTVAKDKNSPKTELSPSS